MCHSYAFRLFASGLVAIAAVVCFFASPGSSQSPKKNSLMRSMYDADPEHLWNRLHEALFVRVGSDSLTYGPDRLEPLLWLGSKHLLEERSRDRAVAVLKEFIQSKGEKLIEDPVKRAILQRDLWLVFNWLEGEHGKGFEEPQPLTSESVRTSQEKLRRPLVAVIGRLALTQDQIKKLPDHYADAVVSGEFPTRFDPEHPDKSYLPADLFAADGPWVCVGRSDGPIAPEHQRDESVFTNSTFLLFIRLPDGRAATLDYLEKLRSFDQPLLVKGEDAGTRKYLPNPKLPQFPVGTEVALVRRALLIDSTHRLVPSALTESVQLRVYREIPQITAKTVEVALLGTSAHDRAKRSWQSVHEFRLSRSLLFFGRAGGLRALGPDEQDFSTGFNAHAWDEFEHSGYNPPDQSWPERNQHPIRKNCFTCHSLPGISSFNSFFNYRSSNMQDGDTGARPFSLSEMPVSEVAVAAVKWKEGRPSWKALQKLLAE
jgi:hypothetical protein